MVCARRSCGFMRWNLRELPSSHNQPNFVWRAPRRRAAAIWSDCNIWAAAAGHANSKIFPTKWTCIHIQVHLWDSSCRHATPTPKHSIVLRTQSTALRRNDPPKPSGNKQPICEGCFPLCWCWASCFFILHHSVFTTLRSWRHASSYTWKTSHSKPVSVTSKIINIDPEPTTGIEIQHWKQQKPIIRERLVWALIPRPNESFFWSHHIQTPKSSEN